MPTSQQVNDLTTSSNGGNIQAKMLPKSHFYIEGAAFAQVEAQAFGPDSVNTSIFNTSARVTLTGPKAIFAICRGQVFIQPLTGTTDKVNLILKPFTQPINGLAIKYFIYRGLPKANFVDDGKVANAGTNSFTQLLWNQFNNFYSDEDPKPDFAEHFIGLPADNTTQTGTDYIDQYFNKVTSVVNATTGEENIHESFELPIVPKGLDFGMMSGEIGLDIVLDFGEYYNEHDINPFKLDLDFARAATGKIDISSQTDAYLAKLMRESCTQFMDVAAFYGLHANGAGELFMDNSSTPLFSPADVYNKLNGFFTKNRMYIYIQANRQRSYHFYGNYEHSDGNTNTLNIGGTDTTMTETTFGTDGWPIHIFEDTQDPSTNVNTLCMQLTTDTHSEAALFVKTGILTSPNEGNFVRGENLLEVPSDDTTVTVDTNYTKYIQFETPSSAADTIACMFELVYEGKQMIVEEYFTTPPADPVYHVLKDIDDVFGLIDAKSFKKAQEDGALPTVVDERLQIVNFPIEGSKNGIGAIRTKKVADKVLTSDESGFQERITYETELDNISKDISGVSKSTSGEISSVVTGINKYGTSELKHYLPKSPYYIKTTPLIIVDNLVNGLLLKVKGGSIPSKKVLGLSKDEETELKNITSNSLNNYSLFFEDIQTLNTDQFESAEGLKYKAYKVKLIAENATGEIKIFSPSNEIMVYSLDQLIFFSVSYGKYIKHKNKQIIFDITNLI